MLNNIIIEILRHIAETTTYSLSDVYAAYQYNMNKYHLVLDEKEILQSMEFFGLYSLDTIDMLANAGG